MPEAPDRTAQNRFLLTSIAIIFIFILAVLVMLGAYPLVFAPRPTSTATITPTKTITPTIMPTPTFTLSPTATRTRRPTFTPTITLTPTRTLTPTLTPTPPGPPTLTPARPIPGDNIYSLQLWSPERAGQLVNLLHDYANTLTRQERGENDINYYSAFRYAIYAQREALLRFPEAPEADSWRWMLALNYARTGNALAAYRDLIVTALNRGETSLEDITRWFHEQEPRLLLSVTALNPVPGYLSSSLIEISDAGSAFILLVETHGGFQGYSLTSNFDFIHKPAYSVEVGDLTGDRQDEIVIYPNQPAFNSQFSLPQVFSLAQIPPEELSFNPANSALDIGTDFRNNWIIQATDTDGSVLLFQTAVFPACPVLVERAFRWAETWFEPAAPVFKVSPHTGTLSYCGLVIDHALSRWGIKPAIQILETLLPAWPPETDEAGKPYPSDAHDEWRFRLGVLHALAGEREQAIEQFETIQHQPSIANSRWIEPAQEFLSTYTTGQGLYRACVATELCDPSLALERESHSAPLVTLTSTVMASPRYG